MDYELEKIETEMENLHKKNNTLWKKNNALREDIQICSITLKNLMKMIKKKQNN